jgi:hypothetical protein
MLSLPIIKCHVDWKRWAGSFHEKFEELFELEQMKKYDIMS